MFDEVAKIAQFILESFLHIWPYLLVTIPVAVAVQLSGAAKYINRAFQARPVIAIFLATFVGAFSPFCSCGVIPVVAALLIGGVPLAPVMAFWVASPSMDPEIFFLSVAALGWPLALWRLGSTLVLSLGAGFVTHFLLQKGWLGQRILRDSSPGEVKSRREILGAAWNALRRRLVRRPVPRLATSPAVSIEVPIAQADRAGGYQMAFGNPNRLALPLTSSASLGEGSLSPSGCDAGACSLSAAPQAGCDGEEGSGCRSQPLPFRRRLLQETWAATAMVVKFMALAFFLEALITLYVPSEWIIGLLGPQNPWAVPTAAVLGVPAYTSNLAALPLIGGLLVQGMNPAAALAFLIAGPTTTLPAMAAVWGLATRRVFALYVSISLIGAVVLGSVYSLVAL